MKEALLNINTGMRGWVVNKMKAKVPYNPLLSHNYETIMTLVCMVSVAPRIGRHDMVLCLRLCFSHQDLGLLKGQILASHTVF